MKSNNVSHAHHDYYRNKKLCDTIFNQFQKSQYQRGMFSKIHQQFGIPSSTIRDWLHKWQLNPEWRPYNGQAHGLHHRIFTKEEESAISDFIRFGLKKTQSFEQSKGSFIA